MAVGRDLRDAAGAVRVQQYSQPVDDQQPIRLQVFTYHLSTEKKGPTRSSRNPIHHIHPQINDTGEGRAHVCFPFNTLLPSCRGRAFMELELILVNRIFVSKRQRIGNLSGRRCSSRLGPRCWTVSNSNSRNQQLAMSGVTKLVCPATAPRFRRPVQRNNCQIGNCRPVSSLRDGWLEGIPPPPPLQCYPSSAARVDFLLRLLASHVRY